MLVNKIFCLFHLFGHTKTGRDAQPYPVSYASQEPEKAVILASFLNSVKGLDYTNQHLVVDLTAGTKCFTERCPHAESPPANFSGLTRDQ